MDDIMSPEQRSKAMSKIKGKDTSIELTLRKALWHKGYRYRKNYNALPGSPDIALTKYKIAVFCDGEFFHGYQWETKKIRLGTNKDYWVEKIERNIARDHKDDLALLGMGWVPLHFWGQDILKHTNDCVDAIEDLIFNLKLSRFNYMAEDY